MKRERGVALVLAIGIITILALIATSFALTMRLEYRSAVNYYHGVKARYGAEAILQKCVYDLKEDVIDGAFDSFDEDWAVNGSTHTFTETGESVECVASIADEQRKINVNEADYELLENLVTVLRSKGSENHTAAGGTKAYTVYSGVLAAGDGTDIADSRPSEGYPNIWHISLTHDKLTLLRPFITTHNYSTVEYTPINVNTADRAVLAAVLMKKSSLDIDTAWAMAGHLQFYRPLGSWRIFDSVVDDATIIAYGEIITSGEADNIKTVFNPNSGSGFVFSFNSGGYYGVTASGKVLKDIAGTPKEVSEQKVFAIVKIYDIIYHTRSTDWDGLLDDGADGYFNKTSWLDNCPVIWDSSYDLNEYIYDSLKMGYVDDFEDHDLTEAVIHMTPWDCDGDGDDELCLNESTGNAVSDWSFDSHKIKVDLNYYAQFPSEEYSGGFIKLWGGDTEVSVSHALHPDNITSTSGFEYHPYIELEEILDGYGYGIGYIEGQSADDPPYTYFGEPRFYEGNPGYDDDMLWDYNVVWERIDEDSSYDPYYVRLWPNSDGKRPPDYTSKWDWNYQGIERFCHPFDGDGTENREVEFRILACSYPGSDLEIAVGKPGAWVIIGTQPNWYKFLPSPRSGPFKISSDVPTAWDNLYLLPDQGEYLSNTLPFPLDFEGWASITGTYTNPVTMAVDYNIVLQTSLSGTGIHGGEYYDIITDPPSGYGYTDLSLEDPSIGLCGNQGALQYKLFFEGSENLCLGTPACEDVTITYLTPISMDSYFIAPPE